jgi:hypothetical protein
MPKERLFGNNIQPACTMCLHGRPAPDQVMVLCERYGPVAPGYKCRHFTYDPLKRKPKRRPPLPIFTPEDFEL